MIEFIKLLFLSKIILLTPVPINIDSQIDMDIKEPISAINGGAHLEINIASMIHENNVDAITVKKIIDSKYSIDSISATLINEKTSKNIKLSYKGGISWGGKKDIRLILTPNENIGTNIEYNQISIKTNKPLIDVSVYWKNFSK